MSVCYTEAMKSINDPRITEARKQAIRMAAELCRKGSGGQWGNTVLRDDNVVILCGERRLSSQDRQGFTVYVTLGTNATHYTLDS